MVLLLQERAEAMERVLAVELLHLLAAEGVYGAQVANQLNASDVWAAYRDQKHDLFLPAGGTAQVRLFLSQKTIAGQIHLRIPAA
jgi:DnaJ family protein C protein 13